MIVGTFTNFQKFWQIVTIHFLVLERNRKPQPEAHGKQYVDIPLASFILGMLFCPFNELLKWWNINSSRITWSAQMERMYAYCGSILVFYFDENFLCNSGNCRCRSICHMPSTMFKSVLAVGLFSQLIPI